MLDTNVVVDQHFVNIIKIEINVFTLLFVSSAISFCERLPNDSAAVTRSSSNEVRGRYKIKKENNPEY